MYGSYIYDLQLKMKFPTLGACSRELGYDELKQKINHVGRTASSKQSGSAGATPSAPELVCPWGRASGVLHSLFLHRPFASHFPLVSTCPGLLNHAFLCIQLGCSFPVLLLREITLPKDDFLVPLLTSSQEISTLRPI